MSVLTEIEGRGASGERGIYYILIVLRVLLEFAPVRHRATWLFPNREGCRPPSSERGYGVAPTTSADAFVLPHLSLAFVFAPAARLSFGYLIINPLYIGGIFRFPVTAVRDISTLPVCQVHEAVDGKNSGASRWVRMLADC